MVDYFYKTQAPLAVPISSADANYEDKILTDEIKRKMDLMVQEAKDAGIGVTSYYAGSQKDKEQPSLEDYKKQSKKYNIPEGVGSPGAFYYNPDSNVINVPMTPNLANLNIMAEELEHALNLLPNTSTDNRAYTVSQRYEEEKRAKKAALDRIGGHMTPLVRQKAKGAMDTYREDMVDKARAEQLGYAFAKAGLKDGKFSDDLFLENYVGPEDQQIYNYWSKKETTPIDYFKTIYPELKGPLSK